MDSKETAEFLVGLSEHMFVLHGSPYLLSTLEPRQAHCGSGEIGNNLNAIYASIVVEFALFRAVIRGENNAWGWKVYDEEDGDQTGIIVIGKKLRLEEGYVYILPRNKFVSFPGTSWLVAFEPVVPLCCVIVQPDIIQYFPGIFFQSGVTM